MIEHLKKFNTHEEYEEYLNSSDFLIPNVSRCVDTNDVHYNPKFFCKLTLNNGDVIDLEGYGEIKREMIKPYSATCVSVEIGDLCTVIGEWAFRELTIVSSITIGNKVEEIKNNAFYIWSDDFKTITVPKNVKRFEYQAFDASTIQSATIECDTETLGWAAFRYCSRLESVVFSGVVKKLDTSTFEGCMALKSVELCNGLEIIGKTVFANCTSMASITLPSSVTTIDDGAFFACSGLTSITSLATTAPTLIGATFEDVGENGTLYVPSGASGYDAWLSKLPQGWSIETIQQ